MGFSPKMQSFLCVTGHFFGNRRVIYIIPKNPQVNYFEKSRYIPADVQIAVFKISRRFFLNA